MSKIRDFVLKLQKLPEIKKKVIFFTVMGVVVLLMLFVEVILTKRNISQISQSLHSINLPSIEIPRNEGINQVQDFLNNPDNQKAIEDAFKGTDGSEDTKTADWKIYTNEKYGFEIKHPSDWSLDKDHSTDLELHFIKEMDKENATIAMEVVSQTRKITSPEKAINAIVAKMKSVVSPKEEISIGEYRGYEAIGTLCTAVCNGSSEDTYSLLSVMYFYNGTEVFYVDYIEGVAELGWKDDIKNWKFYSDFKDIISTFKVINTAE